jgi:hypothetical protein
MALTKYCGSLAANGVEIIEMGNVEISQDVLEMETRRIVEVEAGRVIEVCVYGLS